MHDPPSLHQVLRRWGDTCNAMHAQQSAAAAMEQISPPVWHEQSRCIVASKRVLVLLRLCANHEPKALGCPRGTRTTALPSELLLLHTAVYIRRNSAAAAVAITHATKCILQAAAVNVRGGLQWQRTSTVASSGARSSNEKAPWPPVASAALSMLVVASSGTRSGVLLLLRLCTNH
jgi:hypothetical protein